ncbi:MAG: PH domain-containing protein [Actinomycetota bacterium]
MQEPRNRLSPKVRRLWIAASAAVDAVLLVIVAVLTLIIDLPIWIVVVVLLLAIADVALVPALRYRRWRYEIRSDDLYFSKGAIFLVRTLVPFDRIQYVETRQGPLDRFFGLHQLLVYTGAGKAGSIPGLESGEAQSLRDELSRVSGAVSL